MTADAAIRIVLKPLQRGTLYPQDSIHLPGEIHGFVIHKVCGVQIIKQTLSLAHSSIGSFPRARDTDIFRSGVSSSARYRMLHEWKFPPGSEVPAHGALL